MENKQYPTVLILGASGTIGSQMVKDIEDQPVSIRITSRKQNEVERLCSEGKDCRFLDLDDPQTFALALVKR
jgi:NAD(P)H dehydrogenase (quinone)